MSISGCFSFLVIFDHFWLFSHFGNLPKHGNPPKLPPDLATQLPTWLSGVVNNWADKQVVGILTDSGHNGFTHFIEGIFDGGV